MQCSVGNDWKRQLLSATIEIRNVDGHRVVSGDQMEITNRAASYDYLLPLDEQSGSWSFTCNLRDRRNQATDTAVFTVAASTTEPPTDPPVDPNSAPIANDDSATTSFETPVVINVAANDVDSNLNLNPTTVTVNSGPSSGSAMSTGIGEITYSPVNGYAGTDSFSYRICDTEGLCDTATVTITITAAPQPPTDPPADEPPIVYLPGSNPSHNAITEYNGPATCISCHKAEADEMLNTLHMQWSGLTPDLTNNTGEKLGKGNKGINTFCTYAPSSKGACYSCHVRADGNAPHAPAAEDVDCLMCHSDTYQRTFVSDPNNRETVVNIDGETKTYVFGKVDDQGNYTSVPDYSKMTINVVDAARTVHLPTNKSCLRCHATAGGGDWTKRGDMGMNSANATVQQDVHLAKTGAGLSCVDCHSALNHKISGRGIDLRATEATAPTCNACHSSSPHSDSTLNRHAQGQVSCQVCHIRAYGKGGATEMSRDWTVPTWNQAFCSGQGGYVGEEVKQSNVKPEYVWYDGTSYVYSVGQSIQPEGGILHMAKANGRPFDGKSKIVPIKRHFTNTAWQAGSGKIIPPAIMWMFMTGNFDLAVQKGMEEQGMSGSYSLMQADAEMLITHGVEPKENAPSCSSCHDGSGSTPDGYGMVPFDALGYHDLPADVLSCTKCHSRKSLTFDSMHSKHREKRVSCDRCHIPTNL